jgi:hypothetical protein
MSYNRKRRYPSRRRRIRRRRPYKYPRLSYRVRPFNKPELKTSDTDLSFLFTLDGDHHAMPGYCTLGQGTAFNQVLGNKLRPKSMTFKCKITASGDMNLNNSPIIIRFFVVKLYDTGECSAAGWSVADYYNRDYEMSDLPKTSVTLSKVIKTKRVVFNFNNTGSVQNITRYFTFKVRPKKIVEIYDFGNDYAKEDYALIVYINQCGVNQELASTVYKYLSWYDV